MDPRTAALQTRLATVSGFRDLVNAMRGVAAARAQQARERLAGVDAFSQAVARAMAQALALYGDVPPEAPGPTLRVIVGPEQGFTGGLAERVLASVTDLTGAPTLLVGAQILRPAAARGARIVWHAPLIAHADGAVAAGDALHAALAEAQLRHHATAVELVYPALEGRGLALHRRQLLPLDLAAMRSPAGDAGDDATAAPATAHSTVRSPRVHLSPQALVASLATEHVSAQLVRALLHAHAAENQARLQTLAAAHDHVERMIDTLHADERQLRQAAITEEIVELAAGLRGLRAARG